MTGKIIIIMENVIDTRKVKAYKIKCTGSPQPFKKCLKRIASKSITRLKFRQHNHPERNSVAFEQF